MNLSCIEDLLVGRQRLHPKTLIAHPLKGWFASRNVSQRRLAKALGVSAQLIHNWFVGRTPLPHARGKELIELQQKIMDWESKNKRRFGTEK
jgi:hypothetical protein